MCIFPLLTRVTWEMIVLSKKEEKFLFLLMETIMRLKSNKRSKRMKMTRQELDQSTTDKPNDLNS